MESNRKFIIKVKIILNEKANAFEVKHYEVYSSCASRAIMKLVDILAGKEFYVIDMKMEIDLERYSHLDFIED